MTILASKTAQTLIAAADMRFIVSKTKGDLLLMTARILIRLCAEPYTCSFHQRRKRPKGSPGKGRQTNVPLQAAIPALAAVSA
jgi:hypothetical protein